LTALFVQKAYARISETSKLFVCQEEPYERLMHEWQGDLHCWQALSARGFMPSASLHSATNDVMACPPRISNASDEFAVSLGDAGGKARITRRASSGCGSTIHSFAVGAHHARDTAIYLLFNAVEHGLSDSVDLPRRNSRRRVPHTAAANFKLPPVFRQDDGWITTGQMLWPTGCAAASLV
jgi:hypothetical protein